MWAADLQVEIARAIGFGFVDQLREHLGVESGSDGIASGDLRLGAGLRRWHWTDRRSR